MNHTPISEKSDVTSYEILIEGQKIKDIYDLQVLEVERTVNRIATAKLIFGLPVGDGDNLTFTMSEASTFIPGQSIEIKLGSVSYTSTIFKGIIVNQSIRNLDGSLNELVLRCSDEAVKMTLSRKSAYYQEMKDSAVIGAIVSQYGLTSTVDTTSDQHQQLVKYQSTDWDFIMCRAEANGLLVSTEDGKLLINKPKASGSADLTIAFGRDVFAFDCGIESRFQATDVSCSSWDIKSQTMSESKSVEPTMSKHGNLDGKEIGTKIGMDSAAFTSTAPIDKNELKTWGDAQLIKYRMSMMQGNVTFFGNPRPQLNTLLKMEGFGDRFNGNVLVTSVKHYVRGGSWRTTVGFGLAPEWHYEQRPVSAPSNGGLLPAIFGLQNGTVKKIDADPNGEFRIQVDVPVISPNGVGIWARLSHFYATSGKGSFFLPEVGDEVVLGFLNDDPRYPVILGMLYSSKNKPAFTPDDKNSIKAIVTKNDLRIEFNDNDKLLTIKTPGGNEFTLSDKDKSITLKDQNGNKMEMTSSGVSLDSTKDVVINAQGKIALQANSGITVQASAGDVSLEGLNVNAKAQVAFSAQGSASAEIKASGITTVMGAMVMIN